MSTFWKAYVSVNEDVRHKLVEEAWFGKKVTKDIRNQEAPESKETPETKKDAPENKEASEQKIEPAPVSLESAPISKFYGGPSVKMEQGDFYGTPAQMEAPEIKAPEISPPTQQYSGPEQEL